MKNSGIFRFPRWALFLLSLSFVLSCSQDPLQEEEDLIYDLKAQTAQEQNLIEGHYIVVLSTLPGKKNPNALAALEALSKEVGQMPEAKINHKYTHALTGFAAKLTAKQVEKLRKDPRVINIEQDSHMYPAGEPVVQEAPDWGLDRIDQRENPLDGAYTYTATGTGVTAFLVDTGIRFSHAEFSNRATQGVDYVLRDEPENTDPSQESGEDCWGHGTAVAAVLGGVQSGVAKNVNLVSVRVWGCEGPSPRSRIIEAVDWITQNADQPAVVNMGGSHADALIAAAIKNSVETGIVYTGVAGNNNEDTCDDYPADTAGVLTVGSSDIQNNRAFNSNYGDCVDLYAPGVAITTASHMDDSSFTQYSGTSMSSPFVAGVAALYLEAYPESTPAQTKIAIIKNSTPNAVADVPAGTNNLLYSLWESDFIPPTAPDITLAATGEKVRSNYVANLTWNTTDSEFMYVYIDGTRQADKYLNDGEQQLTLPDKGRNASYILQICEVSYGNCSNKVDLVFGNGTEEPVNSPPSADFSFSTNLLDVQFNDSSTDADGYIVQWNWNFGDGNNSSAQNPFHSFAQSGTFSVSLTVTDDVGNTDSITKNVIVGEEGPSPAPYELSASGYKNKGQWQTDLSWTPSVPGKKIEIYRDGVLLTTVDNSGTYTDATNMKGGGSLKYKVCDPGSASSCSNEVTVQF